MAYGHESGSHSPASTPRSEVSTGSATPDTVVQPMPKGLASRELSGAPREKKSPFVVQTATPQTAINANATQAAPPVRKTPDAKKALPDFLEDPSYACWLNPDSDSPNDYICVHEHPCLDIPGGDHAEDSY